MMDTIVKRHLLTLEVLVIDEIIPVPYNWPAKGTIGSLQLWKTRGKKLKELGLTLWGPPERVAEFITCFPSLKYIHYFNTPNLCYVRPIIMAPESFQIPDDHATAFTPYFCNATNMAALISYVWSRELINGLSNSMHSVGEPTRYIAIGPWWIMSESGHRWRWDEDKARPKLSMRALHHDHF